MRLLLDTHSWLWSPLEPAKLARRVSPTTVAAPLREAIFTNQVAVESGKLDVPHKDPADHFIVATATVSDLTLVTADEAILKSRAVRTLSNG